jgi:pimeloyl-ACP methyl ester carboxylesterase
MAQANKRKINLNDVGRMVDREDKVFETRRPDTLVRTTNFVYDEVVEPPSSSFLCCTGGRGAYRSITAGSRLQSAEAPDMDFCADSLVKLTNGVTAYRLTEPSTTASPEQADSLPVVVCLHDWTNASYMWADAVDVLADSEQGPRARVLVFDFYGRGRSPYIGMPCTLDVFVTQTKELLDFLGLSKVPGGVQLVGFGLGGTVATGFCAKYPSLASSLTLISPMGISYMDIEKEETIKKKGTYANYVWRTQRRKILEEAEMHFNDTSAEAPHRWQIDKQVAMVQWQMENTPGYLDALLSTIRLFPLRSMEELYAAIARHPRPVLVLWGDQDQVTPYEQGVASMEACFANATIVDIRDAGHNVIAERFNETMIEVCSFCKEVVILGVTRREEEEKTRL